MADVSIILKGINQASSAINEVKGDLTGLETGAQGASGGLAGLAAAIPWAVLGAFALKVGDTLLNLEQMREESAQVEARFVGFTGGVLNADTALRTMNDAVGNALTRDEKMAAATTLMGLGISNTAQDAATLTGQALTLGMSVDELARAMETGRVNGLVRYGISTSEVAERVKELQAANGDLTTTEARQIAIREQLAEKATAVAAAGGLMATSMKQFDNATETLKDTIADFINLEGVIKRITSNVTGLTNIMTGTQAVQGVYGSEQGSDEQVAAIVRRRAYLQDLLDRAASGEHIYRFNSANAQKEIDDLDLRLRQLQETDNGTTGMGGFRMAEGYAAARDAANEAAAAASKLGGYNEADYGAMAGKNKADEAGQKAHAKEILDAAKEEKRLKEEQARENIRLAKQAADEYSRAMKQATDKLKKDVEGALSSGAGIAKGLFDTTNLPGMGGALAPGANGPFEAFYRLADVAKQGASSPWAAMYGKTQDEAARIVAAFERQEWGNKDVQALIDRPKLEQYIKDQIAAGKGSDAFISSLVQSLGLTGSTAADVTKLLGGGAQGQLPTTPAIGTASTNITIAAGAIQVVSNDAPELAAKIVQAVIAAFNKAADKLVPPAPKLVAGAR